MPELPRPLPPPSWRDRVAVVASWRDGVPLPALVALIGVVAALALGVTATMRTRAPNADVALSLPRANAAQTPDASVPSALASPTTTTGPLRVHAAGAVIHPGVVQVPAGARVIDVVFAAGGAAPAADLNQVNLAALVTDGERVYIPVAGEVVAAIASPGSSKASAGPAPDAVININEAGEPELEELPGVGPATAKAIVDYRSEHGRFRSVDDLLNVRGIGPAKLEQIKPRARV